MFLPTPSSAPAFTRLSASPPHPEMQPKSSALCLPSSPGVQKVTSEIQGSEGSNAAGSEVRGAEGRNFTSPQPFASREPAAEPLAARGQPGPDPSHGQGARGRWDAGQSPATSYSTRFWPGGCRRHLQCFSLPCWSIKVGLSAKLPKQSYSRKSKRNLKLCSTHVQLHSQHVEPALGASRAHMP